MDRLQRRLLPSTTAIIAFDAVARFGSFTAAAGVLNLTVGAISRHLDQLEDRLGVTLMTRTNKGVHLTDKGKRYADGCAKVIREINAMSLDVLIVDPLGHLNLAILPTFGTRWLFPRISDFVRLYPGITLNLKTYMEPFDLLRDGFDAAIHVGQPDWKTCRCELLLKETMVPVCSPEFLESNPIRSPADLLRLPLLEISVRPNAWSDWFESVEVTGQYKASMKMEHFMNLSQACCAGLGVALLPEVLIQSELSSKSLVRIFANGIDSGGSYYYVYPDERSDYQLVRAFGDWLQTEIQASSVANLRAENAGSPAPESDAMRPQTITT